MTYKFKRKRLLLSERIKKKIKSVGYARASHNDFEYLEKQIESLRKEGCSLVFSELTSLDDEIKPQFDRALSCLTMAEPTKPLLPKTKTFEYFCITYS